MQILPNVIYQITGQDLIDFAHTIISGKKDEVKQGLMNTRQLKKHLKEKGYKVESSRALNIRIADFGLTVEKITGTEKWYRTEEVLAIPARTIKE